MNPELHHRRGLSLYWPWLLAGFAWAIVLAGLLLALYTRTNWGRERVLAFTVETLGGQLNGTLRVARLRGNVVTGAKLYELTLEDPDGQPFVSADSAFIEYRLPTFLGGDVVIRRLELFSARLSLVRLPGDTLWNYQRVLRDTTPDPNGVDRATFVERMRLHDAAVSVGMEWSHDPDLSPAEQRRVLEAALTDTARLMAVAVPGGHLRVMRFDVAGALVTELFIGSDRRGGTYLSVEELRAEARIWRDPPLMIRDLVGELNLREGVLRLNAPRLVLPASVGSLVGEVDLRGDEPQYNLLISSDRIAFADMHWLYPRFPDEGGGRLRLRIHTSPDGFLFFARELDLRAPGTRVTGQFGMLLGDTVRFVDPDLEADPLNVRTVERMLPEGLPVRGLVIGGAEIRRPAS